MQSQWLAPNVITYNSLNSACAKGERTEQASQLSESMESQRLAPNVVTYNALINSCAKVKWAEQALKLFESMQSLMISQCSPALMAHTPPNPPVRPPHLGAAHPRTHLN